MKKVTQIKENNLKSLFFLVRFYFNKLYYIVFSSNKTKQILKKSGNIKFEPTIIYSKTHPNQLQNNALFWVNQYNAWHDLYEQGKYQEIIDLALIATRRN